MMNRTGYFIAPREHNREFVSHAQWSGANRLLSPPECAAIIAMAEEAGWQDASIGSPDSRRIDPSYRCVKVCTLNFRLEADWLYERVSGRVEAANNAYYAFEITGLLEPFQVLRYDAPKAAGDTPGHYDMHQDFGAGYMSRRKLSVVAQLSEGTDYDGCELTLVTHKHEVMGYRGRGEGCLFPSWTPHYVSPITRGTRYAMVAWVHGPPFR